MLRTICACLLCLVGCGRQADPVDSSPPAPQPPIAQNPQPKAQNAVTPTPPIAEPAREKPAPLEEPAPKKPVGSAMVRVMVWDETEKNPVHERAEIWFRDHGSWWLKDELRQGPTAKNLARREIGKTDELMLYIDGRDGQEIAVPVQMTEAMNPNGSPRDSVMVTVYDSKIEVVGLPVEAATGKTSMEFER